MAKYWFRQKTFGYGATPNTWQGWVVTIVSALAVFGVILSGPAIRDNILRAAWIILGLFVIVLVTVTVTHRKTEGGWRWRWRWGARRDGN
jgi:hypothetical protein